MRSGQRAFLTQKKNTDSPDARMVHNAAPSHASHSKTYTHMYKEYAYSCGVTQGSTPGEGDKSLEERALCARTTCPSSSSLSLHTPPVFHLCAIAPTEESGCSPHLDGFDGVLHLEETTLGTEGVHSAVVCIPGVRANRRQSAKAVPHRRIYTHTRTYPVLNIEAICAARGTKAESGNRR